MAYLETLISAAVFAYSLAVAESGNCIPEPQTLDDFKNVTIKTLGDEFKSLEFESLAEKYCRKHIEVISNITDPNLPTKFLEVSTNGSCPMIFDSQWCWPRTAPDTVVIQPCGKRHPAMLENEIAFRVCDPKGNWITLNGFQPNIYGNSFTAQCLKHINEDAYEVMRRTNLDEIEQIYSIGRGARIVELIGYGLSLLTTIIGFSIFMHFKSLQCQRTKIHQNLFLALSLTSLIRIIIHVDEANQESQSQLERWNGAQTEGLCEALYTLLEFTKAAKFTWMFVEGVYLHTLITAALTQARTRFWPYMLFGWGFPVITVGAWAAAMAAKFDVKCWYGYYKDDLVWIVEGPVVAVMLINCLFLLNIIRVLVIKLKRTESSDVQRVKKAVKAAITLLPLLALINVLDLQMLQPEGCDVSVARIGVYIYTKHALVSLEGFLIALLYCFLNMEVRTTVRRAVNRWLDAHLSHGMVRRRMSRTLSIFTSFTTVMSQDRNGSARENGRTSFRGSGSHENSREPVHTSDQNPAIELPTVTVAQIEDDDAITPMMRGHAGVTYIPH